MATRAEQQVNNERPPVRMSFFTRGEQDETDLGFSLAGDFSVVITNKSDDRVTVYCGVKGEYKKEIAPRSGIFLRSITRVGAAKAKAWEGTASFYF
jgi:hypothetical protein